MRGNMRLGRIAGIAITINWSTLILGTLIFISLVATLPGGYPGLLAWVYWCLSAAAVTLFYISLLAHELSHAVVARRRGLVVEGVTLWLFGGVASINDDDQTAKTEWRMALTGPVTSLVLGSAFLLISVGLISAGAPTVVSAIPSWL